MSKYGSIYLIHFDRRYRHAGHYIGWTKEKFPRKRIEKHRDGRGANLMRVLKEHGIGWRVARVWMRATRSDERRLKNWNGAAKLCPVCRYSGRKQPTYTPAAAPVKRPPKVAVATPADDGDVPL